MPVDTTIPKSDLIACPKCKRDSRKVVVEMNSGGWLLVFLIGLWAAVMFSHDHQKGFQCEHCGNVFLTKARAGSKRKGLLWVGVLFSSFAILVIALLVALLRSHHG